MRENIERALNQFGRTTEAKRVECDSAWYKDYRWQHSSEGGSRHYFVNDLLGTRIPITEREYQDDNYKSPIRE